MVFSAFYLFKTMEPQVVTNPKPGEKVVINPNSSFYGQQYSAIYGIIREPPTSENWVSVK